MSDTRRTIIGTAAVSTLAAVALFAAISCSSDSTSPLDPTDAALQWGPAPAVFPTGAEMAVVQGDPTSTSLFTVRLRLPDGYRLPPHTHPTDEYVTVIRGTFLVGMGATFDANAVQALGAGGFVTAPANQAHYAAARGQTIVQVHALGPFALTYVNPSDAPSQVRGVVSTAAAGGAACARSPVCIHLMNERNHDNRH
jgi:quercetin dioxygenase-like cupin family protein